ncbi:MAG: leucine-rich repeat protein [Mycoplasmoidaceae bacterium]
MKRRNWIGFIPIISIASATWLTVFATLWCSNSGPVIPVKGPWDLEDYTYGDEDTCRAWLYYDGQGRDILSVPEHQFENNTELQLVSTNGSEASLTGIGAYAFANCTNLTRVDLGPKIRWIYGGAFNGCPNLKCIDMSMMDSAALNNLISWLGALSTVGGKIADSLPTDISGPYQGLLLKEGTKLTFTQANILKAVGFPANWVDGAVEVHDFMTDTWENVAAQAKLSTFFDYYGLTYSDIIGQIRTLEIDGDEYEVRVIGTDHDVMYDTGNYATLTFQFTTTFGEAVCWNEKTPGHTGNVYDESTIFDYLNSETDGLYKKIEEAMGNVELPQVLVESAGSGQSTDTEDYAVARLFNLSIADVTERNSGGYPEPLFPDSEHGYQVEEFGDIYEYYRLEEEKDWDADPSSAINLNQVLKTKIYGSDTYTRIWMRSIPYVGGTRRAAINPAGAGAWSPDSTELYCVPCFCL